MTFGEHVFLYCERGTNEALLAEPINALSNLGFLFAALIGLQLILWRPREERSPDQFLLAGLVFLIGLGSLAFHLFATRGTELLDVVPISVFMLVYLGFALNRFVGVPPGFTVLLVIGFAALMTLTMQVKCGEGAIGILGPDTQGAKPCLNGSIFYLPALAALVIVGLLAEERGQRAAPYLLWAAAIFAVSVTLRSLDMALCDQIEIAGGKVGTHFAWHLLNALTLFLLLRASLESGVRSIRRAVAAPTPAEPIEPQAETAAMTAPAKDDKAPKPLAERVASATDETTKEDEAPEDEPEPKVLFPA